ncbi:MAG: hypothetical protein ABFD82_00675 [Syntrophaceae bacterium]
MKLWSKKSRQYNDIYGRTIFDRRDTFLTFKSKRQLPLIMVYSVDTHVIEDVINGKVYYKMG